MKKLFAVLLVVLSVFAFTVVASADDSKVLGYTLESSDSMVYSGDTIEVDLVITENDGFRDSKIDILYSEDALTYTGEFTVADSLDPSLVSVVKNGDAKGKLNVGIGGMANLISGKVIETTGVVVTLKFTVAAGYEGDVVVSVNALNKNTALSIAVPGSYVVNTGEALSIYAIDEANHVHTEEVVPGKAATCTESGLTDGSVCTVCGKTVVEQEEIEALGHTEEVVAGKDATCTESGLTDGSKCTVCGETVVEQEEIPALGHTEEVVAAVAPTCTETGLTEGKKCSVCGTVTVAQETVEATGHSWDWVTDKEPTTTEEGEKHEECADCGAKQNEGTVIDKLPTPVDPDIPQMGDNNTVIVLLVVACAALVGVYFTAKRKVTR